MTFKIKSYDSSYLLELNAFINACPSALFYHSLKYIDFIFFITESTNKSLVALDEKGQIHGFLPILEKDGPHGAIINSLPFYGSHGAVLSENSDVESKLWEAYESLVKDHPNLLSSVIVSNFRSTVHTPPGELVDSRIGQVTELKSDLFSTFHYKTRNAIRKAMKNNFRVEENNNEFSFLQEVHVENLTALNGKPKPDSFFKEIERFFSKGEDYKLYIAYKENVPVAGLLLFYFRDQVEYFTPVIREEFRESQVLSLLIFKSMEDAVAKGFKHWNWGGTWKTQEGVYRFKSRWGAVDHPYHYYAFLADRLKSLNLNSILDAYKYFYCAPFSLWEKK